MGKFYPVLVLSLLALTGCAESYTVYVNGFAKVPNTIPQSSRVNVVTDPNSNNPLFDIKVLDPDRAKLGNTAHCRVHESKHDMGIILDGHLESLGMLVSISGYAG